MVGKWIAVVGILGLFPSLGIAQESYPPIWSFNMHGGQILRHTPSFTFDIPAFSKGASLSVSFQTSGREKWHVRQGRPMLGFRATCLDLGGSGLGQAFGFQGTLSFNLLKKKKANLFWHVRSGVALFNSPYDRILNPSANAIGSRLNNFTSFQLEYPFPVSEHLDLLLGIELMHFSNGAVQLPNFGINLPSVSLGASWRKKRLKVNYFLENLASIPYKRWKVIATTAFTVKESFVEGGPKYPLIAISLEGAWVTPNRNLFLLGLEFENDGAAKSIARQLNAFSSFEEAQRNARRFMFFSGYEFSFGPLGVYLKLGTYFNPDAYLIPFPVYTKVGVRYYFSIKNISPDIQMGLFLKSHRTVAEYIAFGIGFSFP